MNKDFFELKYSDEIKSETRGLMQKDGHVYATFYPTNNNLMLVVDDITYRKENYNNKEHSRAYDGVKCISFLDKGIMTTNVFSIDGKYQEIWYLNNWYSGFENYNKDRFDFEISEINNEEAIKCLRKVFYLLQPSLQSQTLAGGGEKFTETDPNYYSGTYYLKDGEEYTILKNRKTLEFYKGSKTYNYMFKSIEERNDCLYREEIDFDLYKKSTELMILKNECSSNISEMMNYKMEELKNKLNRIEELTKELNLILN